MSVQLDWAHLCEEVIVEKDTDNQTLVRVFTSVESKIYPTPLSGTLVFRLSGIEKQKLSLTVRYEADGELIRAKPFFVPEGKDACGIIVRLIDFVIPKNGNYSFVFFVQDEEIGRTGFEAKLTD